MTINEVLHRLSEAKTNTSLNVNCIGLVLFVLGITDREEPISPTAYRIKRNLKIISKGFQSENQIPLEASVIGFWSKEGKFYPHLALLLPTEKGRIGVYEREGDGQPVRPNTVPNLIQEYENIWGSDQIEVHFLRRKT